MSNRTEELLEPRAPRAPAARPAEPAAPVHGAMALRRAVGAPGVRPADVLQLQRALGNRATGLALAARPVVQAKLTVNAPGDVYEQEADAVARQVVSAIDSPSAEVSGAEPSVQRVEEEENRASLFAKSVVQRQVTDGLEKDEDEALAMAKPLQRDGEGGAGPVAPEVEGQIQAARGGGQPMDASVRAPMEGAFGVDFGGVRIHTGSQATELSDAVQARAFTTGTDIFFRGGEYDPASSAGKELLAHELTHVVQQNGPALARKDRPGED